MAVAQKLRSYNLSPCSDLLGDWRPCLRCAPASGEAWAYDRMRFSPMAMLCPTPDASGMDHERGHKALRKGRVSRAGCVYLLTTTTASRRPIFADPVAANLVSEIAATPAAWPHADVLCWVLMPDHWHGLLRLRSGGDLSRTMNAWKAVVARSLHEVGFGGRIWARGFHDHALRAEEDVRHAAAYVINNPVRARLVEEAKDYPWWGCVWDVT